ncbi:MAG: VOC family protein [Pseudomonadota bacterium]
MRYQAPKDMRIGHVHLRVSDLERSIAFYRDVIGLDVVQRYGAQAAFLSAGGYHHHIGLNTWQSKGSEPAPKRFPGLFHAAFLFPDRASLGLAVVQAMNQGVAIDGSADHGVSEAVYFDDPDGNGIELYRDRNPSEWPRNENGDLVITNSRLDLAALLREARGLDPSAARP